MGQFATHTLFPYEVLPYTVPGVTLSSCLSTKYLLSLRLIWPFSFAVLWFVILMGHGTPLAQVSADFVAQTLTAGYRFTSCNPCFLVCKIQVTMLWWVALTTKEMCNPLWAIKCCTREGIITITSTCVWMFSSKIRSTAFKILTTSIKCMKEPTWDPKILSVGANSASCQLMTFDLESEFCSSPLPAFFFSSSSFLKWEDLSLD